MSLGSHCRELSLTLRVAELDEDTVAFHDDMGTWLTGHTERITFGRPFVRGSRLLVPATVHIPCKYLEAGDGKSGQAICSAHGMKGRVPASRVDEPATLTREGASRIMEERAMHWVPLQDPPVPRRSLPTVQGPNPCAGAPCRTGDTRRGAACCWDMTMDIVLDEAEVEKEALLRSRISPYLCKVNRVDEDLVECEIISACGHLGEDRLSCTLHGKVRPDGSPAKPAICYEWPSTGVDTVYHPGCRLIPAGTSQAT